MHLAVSTCSLVCFELYQRIRSLDGISETEIAAIRAGADAAGQYLDSIGKTDLAKLTESEWLTVHEASICTALDYLAAESNKAMPWQSLPTKCSVCNEPQFETVHGTTCKNGHGGAEPLSELVAKAEAGFKKP